MKSIEKDVWINQRTGEEIEARQVVKRVGRDNFEILYLAYFFDLIEKLGSKKYKVFKCIIENKSYDNTLIITNRELAEKAEVSIRIVTETLKLLREAKIINTRTGAIILNPKMMNKGTIQKEAYLIQKFEEWDTQKNEPEQAKLL